MQELYMPKSLLNKLVAAAMLALLPSPLIANPTQKALPNQAIIDREQEMLKAAKDYESIMIHQFIKQMHDGIPVNSITGGGNGEKMFRDLLYAEYAKAITQKGGIGLADSIVKDMKKKDTLYNKLSKEKHE